MGPSNPVPESTPGTFDARYAAFRTELQPREQEWFDALLPGAQPGPKASTRPFQLDLQGPVMLAVLLEGMRLMGDPSRELSEQCAELEKAIRTLTHARLAGPGALAHGPTPADRPAQEVSVEG